MRKVARSSDCECETRHEIQSVSYLRIESDCECIRVEPIEIDIQRCLELFGWVDPSRAPVYDGERRADGQYTAESSTEGDDCYQSLTRHTDPIM